ncbi:MAG: sugar phosphate isomerase/epimerase family protein [Planctomycetaceae bacterium]
MRHSRRQVLKRAALGAAGAIAGGFVGSGSSSSLFADQPTSSSDSSAAWRPRLGLVTYNWGKDWDVPTLIANCGETGFQGVELRSTHKHGVEITLSAAERSEVRKRFADSSVELVGLGSACEYHSTDPAVLAKNIDETKAFITLCHDVGGSGVKVRPNGLPADRPVEQTLEQIGKSLNEVARFGAEHGVQIRLEVHGKGTDELPHIRTIMDVADHPNATVCWNCNGTDLKGEGLDHNFRLVQARLGTIHIHDLTFDAYPWAPLFALLRQADFRGWTLLEEGKVPDDIVAAMHANRQRWEELVVASAGASR